MKNKYDLSSDVTSTIHELKEIVRKFCVERDWDRFHNAKDLAIALSIEASELLEIFRWKSRKEVEKIFRNEKDLDRVKDELADVIFFALRLAQVYGIDVSSSLVNKINKNVKKYPIEKFKGSNKKYNEI